MVAAVKVSPPQPRLRVLRAEATRKPATQDCSTCRNARNCFNSSTRYVAINLVICRMLRNIDRDRSARILLELLRPKINKIAQDMNRRLAPAITLDIDEATADIESAIIEYILSHYLMGELAYPLYFLFGGKNGVMWRWSLAYVSKARKAWKNLYPVGGATNSEEGDFEDRLARLTAAATDGRVTQRYIQSASQTEDELIDKMERKERVRQARRVIDDGVTFRLAEYRVLSFCMVNARDRGARRPIDGLHAFMSERMGVVRSRITRIFADATSKLTQEMA